MHQRKSKKILVYFFLLIVVSSISNNAFNNLKFDKIKNIKISGLDKKDNQILLNKIEKLNLENIFFINKNDLNELINSNSLIEKYEIFKRYPSTIDVKIEKTNFLAKINKNGKTFLIGSNGKLTPAKFYNHDLPFVFGKPNINEFLNFKKKIDKSNFLYEQIEELYFFPSKRWDLKLNNNIVLKLPNNFKQETLNNLNDFLKNYDGEKFTLIDARIENQIILNE